MTATARIWGRNAELIHTLNTGDVRTDGQSKTITLPMDHPISEWLTALDVHAAPFLTVDGDGGQRWSGRLNDTTARKAGGTWTLESSWLAA